MLLFALTAFGAAAKADAQATTGRPERLGGVTTCIPLPHDTLPRVPSVVIAGAAEGRRPGCRVPISPRAAFIRSLLAPGLAQRQLGRPRAAIFFLATEAGALGMVGKSLLDLNEAKAARRDTVATPVIDPTTGLPVIDTLTGRPQVTIRPRNQNLADRIRARRTHLEDWLAVVAFNHLIAGADAYVAANLADFEANVRVTSIEDRTVLVARIHW